MDFAAESVPLVATVLERGNEEECKLSDEKELIDNSPSKVNILVRLWENKSICSPRRFNWICSMLEKLVVEPNKLDAQIVKIPGRSSRPSLVSSRIDWWSRS